MFIDVAVCCSYECYSKEHPVTREQAFEYKNKLFEEISKLKMFCGTENGHENAVKSYAYSEGMMSIPEYRSFDSGRRALKLYIGGWAYNILYKSLTSVRCGQLFELSPQYQ